LEHRIVKYPLEQGALEIEYIEEFFGEYKRRKKASEIVARLENRDHLILMAMAPLPDDPGTIVPASYKVAHEIRAEESISKLADLVERLRNHMRFENRRILYTWIGGTRRDWRGQGHFRALTEQQEAWAIENGFDEILVKTKNRFYEMRSTLAQLHFDVIRFVPHPGDTGESKVFLRKRLGQHVVDAHRSRRSVVRADE
jgi:GNAT superfamily N-acetyltransferase